MSTKGGPVLIYLHLACQGGCSPRCPPVSYATVHRIPISHNANRPVRNIALLHNALLRGVLGVDHVLTKYLSIWFGNTSCK